MNTFLNIQEEWGHKRFKQEKENAMAKIGMVPLHKKITGRGLKEQWNSRMMLHYMPEALKRKCKGHTIKSLQKA
jgi:hypothetical protein